MSARKKGECPLAPNTNPSTLEVWLNDSRE
jgi:hypothetical protein